MNSKTFQYLLVAAMAAVTVPVAAQETYQDTKLIGNDLNGTARYVGMGGAMEALGADISTISSNPAGLALFRKGQVTLSAGVVSQAEADTKPSFGGISAYINGDKTNLSFDQVGVVWPLRSGRNSYLNFGFNYHKSRNFDQILNAAGNLSNASQNKLSAIKYAAGVGDLAWNAVDANYEQILSGTGDDGSRFMDYYNGSAYLFGQYQKGYIGAYDFSISGSIGDRVYLGVTMGVHDVNYRSNSYYTENLRDAASSTWEGISESWENVKIDGTGVDVKVGAIFRPVEESPFRIGVYVNSPVFYDLTLRSTSDLSMADNNGGSSSCGQSATYDFKVYTPWKFGLSLGHTVGGNVALGATYEYSDYGSMDNRIIDGGYFDAWYGDYYDTSSSDRVMNDHTKRTLKGVHTLKLGMEVKPIKPLALRVGYNYLSSAFEEDGFRDGSLESPGVAYATSADYTNWKSTNRFTLGLGYQVGKLSVDFAYQYSQTNGDFYPFMSYDGDRNPEYNNVVSAAAVTHKRYQALVTLGYRF